MKLHAVWVGLLLIAGLGAAFATRSNAAVTAEHRKQIDVVKKELGKVKGLIAKKDLDEASKIVDDADQKLKQLAKDAGIDESDRLISTLLKQVETHREAIAKKRGGAVGGTAGAGGGSFEKDVAPILVSRCLRCHGDENG